MAVNAKVAAEVGDEIIEKLLAYPIEDHEEGLRVLAEGFGWTPEKRLDVAMRLRGRLRELGQLPDWLLAAEEQTGIKADGIKAEPSLLPHTLAAPGVTSGTPLASELASPSWHSVLLGIADFDVWMATAVGMVAEGRASADDILGEFELDRDDVSALRGAKKPALPQGPLVPSGSGAEVEVAGGVRRELPKSAKPVVALPQGLREDDDRPVLNPNSPYDIASVYVQRHCIVDGHRVLWHWQDQFYLWSGRIYEVVPAEVMRGQMYSFLHKSLRRSGQNLVPYEPDSRKVNEVIDSLRSQLALGTECQPPMWIEDRESATDWVVFQNLLVNVLTQETRSLTPDLWTHSSLEFAWDPDAECPQWMEFLGQVFPGPDMESINLLEEWMGYCMTEEIKFHKALLMIGVRRSGKGTISRVLQQLVGNRNYVGLSFNTWIYSENSKEVLIGKRVGVFADVRFKPGKTYGQNYDAGGITHQSAEFLLNITGGDPATIGRKYKTPWQGLLRLKLMVISNEPPNLNDTSGVLPSRFVKLHFRESFYDREDINLQAKLHGELSGIAVRCVQAYKDLCDRGRFVQPKAANVLEREVLEASDPFSAMVGACFVGDLESTATASALCETAQGYLRAIGRPDEAARVRDNNIINRLRGVPGFENVDKAPREHGKTRKYFGVRIRPRKEWKESLE